MEEGRPMKRMKGDRTRPRASMNPNSSNNFWITMRTATMTAIFTSSSPVFWAQGRSASIRAASPLSRLATVSAPFASAAPKPAGNRRLRSQPANRPTEIRSKAILMADDPVFLMIADSTMRLCAIRQMTAMMVISLPESGSVPMTAIAE